MAASAPATTTLAEAFDKLKASVTTTDAAEFQSTSLEDVWKAARNIECLQQRRQSVRNLRRIGPLLDAIGKYSKVIEVLCNGTPYLPWIWAPIKLMLQLASEYTNIFEKLVTAYAQIAEALPRFDRFEEAFRGNPAFQDVLAVVYADILEFHRRAYKFFRRRAWHIVFNSLWHDFAARFNGILESLARHTELVDKEALSISIVEARSWRKQAQLDLETRELDRQASQFNDAVTWLAVESRIQEDDLDRLTRRRGPGTCDWILKVPRMTSWLNNANGEPVLWLRGIPGAGKSVLCSHIIGFIQKEQKATVAYYFCNSHTDGRDLCSQILRSLVLQLLRHHLELAPHVCGNYASRGYNPSMLQLRILLPELLDAIPAIRIIIDGLDECDERLQREIMQELLFLCKSSDGHCKILFSSREGIEISRALRKKQYISLKDEKNDVDIDVQLFTHQSLIQLRERFSSKEMDDIEKKIVTKANGMFLWVRLVANSLKDCYSIRELQKAANDLPSRLNEAYGRILSRILNEHSPSIRDKAIRILEWMACSFRPLKVWEIQDGIVFQAEVNTILDELTKLPETVLELCKPMIEKGPGHTVDFVHFSAKEYMLHPDSGPFLHENQAHYNVCFSCVTYLSTTYRLIDPSFPEYQSRLRIVKGYHGLHLYANEFWTAHLLEYIKSQGGLDIAVPAPLLGQLRSLGVFRKDSQSTEFQEELRAMGPSRTIDSHVAILNTLPDARGLVQAILTYRQVLAQEKHITKSPEDFQIYEVENDPTYFSEVLRRYQSTVESLLSHSTSETLEAIDQEDLNYFRKTYGDSSYICRYRQCPRASNGFRSQKDREAHEVLHVKRFKCADTSCEFYVVGFATKNALKTHDQRYHTKQKDNDVPKFPQKASKILPETRREDSTNQSHLTHPTHLSPTSAAGQGFPTQYEPLRSYEIAVLPFLSLHLRQYYSDLAKNCWDVIEKPNEPRDEIPYFDPSTAQQQLYDLSCKLRTELLACQRPIEDVGSVLSKLKLTDLPADLKKEADTWHAVFNPQIPRILDVNCPETLRLAFPASVVAFSQDGKRIAIGSKNLVDVFGVLTGMQTHSFQFSVAYNNSACGVCFSPDGKLLAIGSKTGEIRLCNLDSHQIGRVLNVATVANHPIEQLIWSKKGNIIVPEGTNILVLDPDNKGDCRCMISAECWIRYFSVSSDGEHLAAGTCDRSVSVWQCESGTLRTQYYGHNDEVTSVAFSPDGKRIISGSRDCTVKIWAYDGTKSSCLATLKGHEKLVLGCQFTQDGLWILSASYDDGLHFWNTTGGELQARLVVHEASVTRVVCSPTKNVFATVSFDGKVRIWSYGDYQYQQTYATKLLPIPC